MMNPIESPFTSGKMGGMSGAMKTSSKSKMGKGAKMSPSGKMSSMKPNMASKSGRSGK